MAKIYGDRWTTITQIANSGQADVFRVGDLKGEHPGELVLKRVRNPKRHDRFKAEVEAIKRLDHPNVIRLIDHSAFAAPGQSPDKQFIVMPLAQKGDLTKRILLYKGNPDSVLLAAQSIARALQHAHGNGIIHRDVKPQNILFPEESHEIWLADFGICLIRDLDRSTPAGEVVGPTQFMAPELEEGGHLEVTPAADVYSLGKVIYYMLSGGTVLPRERLQEEEFSRIFAGSQRLRLFENLLRKMVCALPNRIVSMDEVLKELDRIERWEKNALELAISPKALSSIQNMQRNATDVVEARYRNEDIRQRRLATLKAATTETLDWFAAALEQYATMIQSPETIRAGVRRVNAAQNKCPVANTLRPMDAVELWLSNSATNFKNEHTLRLSICSNIQVTTRSVEIGGQGGVPVPPLEPEHSDIYLLPCYGVLSAGRMPTADESWMYFNSHHQVWKPTPMGRPTGPNGRRLVAWGQNNLNFLRFSTSAWPGIADQFPAFIPPLLETFVGRASGG